MDATWAGQGGTGQKRLIWRVWYSLSHQCSGKVTGGQSSGLRTNQQKGLQVGPREGREFLGCCAHLGVEDGWCHHWPRSWPKVLSPGFLVGGAWGEADKVGTVERVGSMKAGTCLVSHMGAEEVCGATGGAQQWSMKPRLGESVPSVHRPALCCGRGSKHTVLGAGRGQVGLVST